MAVMDPMTTKGVAEAFTAGAGFKWLDDLFPITILAFIAIFYIAGGAKTVSDVVKQNGKKEGGEVMTNLIGVFIGIIVILAVFSMF